MFLTHIVDKERIDDEVSPDDMKWDEMTDITTSIGRNITNEITELAMAGYHSCTNIE